MAKKDALRKALDKAIKNVPKKEKKKAGGGKKAGGVSATNLRGKIRLPETEDGQVVFQLPFPKDVKDAQKQSPIIIKWHYEMEYIHSYAQDSPFFAGLSNKKLLGTRCEDCKYTYATPKKHCMNCGNEIDWVELPQEGKVHAWTTCYFGSQEFLDQTPFNLVLVEFEGVNTLLLSRLVGLEQDDIEVGMKIKARFKRNSKLLASDVYFIPA